MSRAFLTPSVTKQSFFIQLTCPHLVITNHNKPADDLPLSHSGSLVAMGTTDGDISVYDCRELKVLIDNVSVFTVQVIVPLPSPSPPPPSHTHTHPQLLTRVSRVHSVFVTGLTFVPTARDQQPPEQPGEALLSVSADRTCCVTMVTTQSGEYYDIKLTLIPDHNDIPFSPLK